MRAEAAAAVAWCSCPCPRSWSRSRAWQGGGHSCWQQREAPLRWEAPQILFDRVMDIPVDARGWCTQCKLSRKPMNLVVVDVPVIMQLQFQQFLVHEREGASDSVHRQSAGLPVVQQRRILTVQTVQKITEIPQVLFVGWTFL